MFTNRVVWRVMPARQALVIRLIVIVAIAVTTGFIRIQTDQVIAPPGLRYWIGSGEYSSADADQMK